MHGSEYIVSGKKCSSDVSNSWGGNLGSAVTPARTSGLSSTQGIG